MRSLRTTMIAGISALAIGSTVALAGPALAADHGEDSPRDLGVEVRDRAERSGEDLPAGVTPAEPVPDGATIIDGGVIEVPGGGERDVPAGVTPAQPVPEGATIIDGGVVGTIPGDELAEILHGATGDAIAQPSPGVTG